VAEAGIPPVVQGEGSGKRTLSAWFLKHDWHYSWTYKLERTPLSLTYQGSRVRMATGLTGDLTAQWDTLPGDISSEVEADAGVEADLALGPDWRLKPTTQTFLEVRRADVPIGIAWDGNFFGETVSIAEPVKEALRPALDRAAADWNQKLAGVDLRPGVEALWRDLQEPRALPGSEKLWFSLAPQTVAVAALTPGAEGVDLTLVLTARPGLIAGARPDPVRRPLGAPGDLPGPGTKVVLDLPLALDWDRTSADLLAQLKARGPLKPSGGGLWTVSDLALSSDGDRVLVRLGGKVSPPWPGPAVDASAWLTARPAWDPQTRTLQLLDLVFEDATLAYLKQKAPWLVTGSWLADLDGTLAWPLGPQIDRLGAQAQAGLAGLALGTKAEFSSRLGPGSVVDHSLTDRGAEVLVRFEGTGSLDRIP